MRLNLSNSSSDELINILNAIIEELQTNRDKSDSHVSEQLLEQYFYRFIHLIKEKADLIPNGMSEHKIRIFMEETVRYFNANYNSDISIKEYAKKNYMSASWFMRNFKKYQGVSPSRYIIDLRISKAKELLKNTGYNIGQIGEMVGYENSLYFSRSFKKETGVSPREYRKSTESR